MFPYVLNPFPHNDPFCKTLWEKEKLVVQAISAFPPCFLLYQRQKLSFLLHLICHLQILSIWSCSEFCHVGICSGKFHHFYHLICNLQMPSILTNVNFCHLVESLTPIVRLPLIVCGREVTPMMIFVMW